jgi:hypothetical protein
MAEETTSALGSEASAPPLVEIITDKLSSASMEEQEAAVEALSTTPIVADKSPSEVVGTSDAPLISPEKQSQQGDQGFVSIFGHRRWSSCECTVSSSTV